MGLYYKMKQTAYDSLELATIQNELLLSIGLSLNLEEMLLQFMQTALAKLELRSIQTYTSSTSSDSAKQHVELESHLKLPINHEINRSHIGEISRHINDAYATSIEMAKCFYVDDSNYAIFVIDKLGVIALETHLSKLHQTTLDGLVPIIKKLSIFSQACFEHSALKNEVNKRKRMENTYLKQARQDPLTNLPNRREFRNDLHREITRSQRHKYYGAIMYIDLDHFKNINDSLGHSVGDMLLTQVAIRLKKQARTEDNVYRIGGDEFVYLLSNIGETRTAAISTSQTVAGRIIEIMAEPLKIGDYTLHVTPSIGIAVFPTDNEAENDSESVLKHADTAMYRAKDQGRNNYEFYNPDMQLEASKRLIIEDMLRKSLARNEFYMEYQPLISKGGHIIGAEALLRWNSAVLGRVPPNEFIGIAEESNLILEVSEWVLNAACSLAKKIQPIMEKSQHFKYISINLSPKQFVQQNFVSHINDVIKATDISPKQIRLEFTESILVHNIDDTIAKMNELIDSGIDFLLDDFGTGYSSLSYLHRLPIHILKIDKSFINDIHTKNSANAVIVDAIIAMTERMGLQCIIEGVETEQDAEYFINKGVYAMQGFYYHRPLPEEALIKLLTDL